MQYSLFLRNKIKRQLACNGQNFEFKKVEKDSYGQTKLSDKTIHAVQKFVILYGIFGNLKCR